MTQKNRKIDLLRLIALCVVLLCMLYFYLNVFFPRFIPPIFRLGIIDRPLNVLVIGTDITFNVDTGKANIDKGRTDTIMLVRYDSLKGKAFIASIPRDSYVEVPGYGYMKINAAFVLGGVDLTKQTIKKLTNVDVDKFVLINTKGIVKLVDLLGGVTVDVEKDMYYTDKAQDLYINLKQGKHKLSGKEAEGYIRFRHDAMGDLGRITRQQEFLKDIAGRLASPTSILKAPFIIEIIMNNVRSDLSIKDFVMIANGVRMMKFDKIESVTLPGETADNQAGSVVLLNREELQRIISRHF